MTFAFYEFAAMAAASHPCERTYLRRVKEIVPPGSGNSNPLHIGHELYPVLTGRP
jgi:hypothetical protein